MKKVLLPLLFLIVLPTLIMGQNTFRVMGKVTDTRGEPLIGANVYIKVLNTGGATDVEGKYLFEVPRNLASGQTVSLTVSFVGYKSKSENVVLTGNSISQDFVLDEDVFQSEAVVVTGIASKTSKAVAEVSVARVAAADLQQVNAYGGLSQLVGGKVSGVQLSTSSGNIGSGWRFWVRGGGGLNGDGQPTIYVDGVRMDNAEIAGYAAGGQGTNLLTNLNANDIDKVEFLKGPAAASMYGVNGSNGVVLITTKAGKLMQGLAQTISIDYRFNYGYNEKVYTYSKDQFLSADDANRQFRVGPIREHFLSAAGGNPTLRYYTSFETRDETGIMPMSAQTRNSVRLNLTTFPTEGLSIKLNSNYINNKINRPSNDNIIYGFLGNTIFRAVSFGWVKEDDLLTIQDGATINQFVGSVNLSYKPIKDLEIVAGIGLDNSEYYQQRYFPPGRNFGGLIQKGQKGIFDRKNKQFTYDINASYSYNLLDMIDIRSTVGSQIFNRTWRTTFVQGEQFNSDLITNLGAAGTIVGYGEGFQNEKQAGIYTEHSLSYLNQYFMTLGLRKDYASTIGEEAPSIIYPKASFAIRMDKYGFLPEFVNMLKLRVAYGESGVLPGSQDAIPLLWRAETGGYGAGAVLSAIGNAKIEPERIKEVEVGFDTELFNNVSLEFTYYRQNALNSIVGLVNAPSTGKTITNQPYNVGKVENSGFETLLQYTPFNTVDYNLNLSFIWNYQQNKVTDMGIAPPQYFGFNSVQTIQNNFPKAQYYVQKVTGPRYSSNGKYDHTNGPLKTTERYDYGSPVPDHTGSFTVNFKFLKNFNLYAMAEFALNYKVYNYTQAFAARFGNVPEYNRYIWILGLPELAPNTAPTSLPQLTPGTPEYTKAAEEFAQLDWRNYAGWIEDADYLIIREVSLSYDFTDLLRQFDLTTYLKGLYAGISVRNLARITKYSGADVEFNATGGRGNARAMDFGTLQTPRTVNFWLRIGI
jgi:TonB-dependent SusC/RagA subfamily outer membrane receptor